MKNINNNIREKHIIIISSLMACMVMFAIEKYIAPTYLVKSVIKLFVFILPIIIYMKIFGKEKILEQITNFKKKELKSILFFSVGVYFFIIIMYLLLKNYIDLESIRSHLLERENVSVDNFLYVSLYISFINSFLEELFFRGFIFLRLAKSGSKRAGYFISSMAFSIYHVSIISSWFNIWIFVLIILGLVLVGYMFSYVAEKTDSFMGPWLLHVFANLGINTIGFIMLGILN